MQPAPGAITVTVTPVSGTVPAGGSLVLTATVANAGNTSLGVNWAVNGTAGGNASLGTIATTASSTTTTTALYTAPSVPPAAPTLTVTATSVADASKSASATITIVCASANSISPATVTLALGQTQSFAASFCGLAGATITWDVNGIVNGNTAFGSIAATGGSRAIYTAPAANPGANQVTIHASAAAPTGMLATATAIISLVSNVGINISPASATVATGQRSSFVAAVSNTSDISVTWYVNGLPDGNSAVGQVCQRGSNPCVPAAVPSAGPVDYLAPAFVPTSDPVSLTAVSDADPTRSATAMVSVVAAGGSISISIFPPYVFLPPSGSLPSAQQFIATVRGSGNAGATWSIQSGVAGQGCAGPACGSISPTGLYSAPSTAPSPNAVSVVATSQADPTQFATAVVAFTSGPVIETVRPSSVMAGAVQSFPLSVQGANFVAGSNGSGSTILVGGAARATTCASATSCAAVLSPADVQSPGTLTLQVRNTGSPGALSNPVPFVVAPFEVPQGVISLTSSQPAGGPTNIIVTDPTNAASSSPLNVEAVGYLTGGNTCGVQGSPVAVARPVSGLAIAAICVYGAGLDAFDTFSFTAPESNANDIGVTASAVAGLLPGMIELDLQISSDTAPGVRSLFIANLNNDRAVASGVLEVQ